MTTSSTDTMPPEPRRLSYLILLTSIGLVGWVTLFVTAFVPNLAPTQPPPPGLVPFAMFFIVIVAARSMAFRLLPHGVVSLDSGFYIAAAVCLGSVTAGRLVALALTLDAGIRMFGREAAARRARGSNFDDLAYVVYFGGMTGALLMAVSWLFGVDGFHITARAGIELDVVRMVFVVGLVFLIAHYAIQGVRFRLLGEAPRSYVANMAVPGVLFEASLLPLAVVVVLLYHPQRPLGFVLLAATYLLINFVVNRLWRRREQLHQRVSELETLNATAHRLAASLQLHELVEAVARETVRAIPAAELLTLSHRSADGDRSLVVDSYDRERDRFERFRVPSGQGCSGWVIEHNESLSVPDLARSELAAGLDSGVRSWLGVPIVIYDQVEGVLAIQSRERGAFGGDHRRLLEAIGAQTAVALQNARLYELAMVDGLTGLFVRRYFDARLDEEIERSRRFGTPFAVVMMDIDDFKQLNDTWGHMAGDRALRGVAALIKREMRGVDTAARYGGEEFAMILPRTGLLDAYNLAERIRVRIAGHRIADGDRVISVTASFGISSYPDSGQGSSEDLIRRADIALYRAKQTGKNRVELFWADGERSVMKSV